MPSYPPKAPKPTCSRRAAVHHRNMTIDDAAHEAPRETRMESLAGGESEMLDVLSRFYDRENADVSHVQAAIEHVSAFFGSPTYFAAAVVVIVVWIAINTWGAHQHWQYVDEPPFYYLQGLVSAHALLLTIAVLIRQNRMAELAEHRAHLDLQINLITERKVTKLLQLQDEERSDVGGIAAGDQSEAEGLVTPVDPEALLAASKQGSKSTESRAER
jgi:uncharacterized membrane protein